MHLLLPHGLLYTMLTASVGQLARGKAEPVNRQTRLHQINSYTTGTRTTVVTKGAGVNTCKARGPGSSGDLNNTIDFPVQPSTAERSADRR